MNRSTMQGIGIASALAASLVMGTGCAHFCEMEKDQDITMNDLPAAVKAQAEKEVAGCKILEVEKEIENGKVVYAVTYDEDGTKMEVEYSEDGKLLSKGKE